MLKWTFVLLILIIFSAATALLNTENAFAQNEIKFDQKEIILGHSDYVTLLDTSEGTTIEVYVQEDPDRTTGEFDLTQDYRGHHRTLVEFTSSGISGDNPPTLVVNNGETVKARVANTSFEESSAKIIVETTVPDYPNRIKDSTLPSPCVDNDGDGLCQNWEKGDKIEINWDADGDGSVSFVYEYNCDAEDGGDELSCTDNQRDIFVEFDSMQSHTLNKEAIEEVKQAFENEGILFHYQLDNHDTKNILHDDDGTPFPGSNRSNREGFDQMKAENFGTPCERAGQFGIECDNNDPNLTEDEDWKDEGYLQKRAAFHYVLSVHKKQGSGISGIAETLGNDAMISLGTFDGMIGNYDQQEGTIMHEIGHNLGLRHGGSDNINCKPNYLSIMSYSRQFNILFDNPADRSLDYSHEKLGVGENNDDLLEDNLNEVAGLNSYSPIGDHVIFGSNDGSTVDASYEPGGSVNWDHIPGMDEDTSQNINNIPSASCTSLFGSDTLDGYDDWEFIELDFKENTSYYSDGNPTSEVKFNFNPSARATIPHIEKPDIVHPVTGEVLIPGFDPQSLCFTPEDLRLKVMLLNPRISESDIPDPLPDDLLYQFRICEAGPESDLSKVNTLQDISNNNSYAEQTVDRYGLKKSEGVTTPKFGSATKDIVCGDRLCKEIESIQKSYETNISTNKKLEVPLMEDLESFWADPVFHSDDLTSKDVKNMRILKINNLEKIVDSLNSTDFGKGGENNRNEIKNKYFEAREHIRNDRIFEAMIILQEINYGKLVSDPETRTTLQGATIRAQNTLGQAVPEFGEIALFLLIPLFLVIVGVSRSNKFSLGGGFAIK